MKRVGILFLLGALPYFIQAQSTNSTRYISVPQNWYSLNTLFSTSSWLVVADIHYRHRTQPLTTDFWFVRLGIGHGWKQGYKLIGGYAHMWHPSSISNENHLDENRLYFEGSYAKKSSFVSMFYRVRWEHRFIEVSNDSTIETAYRQRYRILLSATFRIFHSSHLPAPVIADELLLQTGKDNNANFFDQNRFFIGLRQSLSKSLSFDIGYMPIIKNTNTTGLYECQHTFRWFWYWSIAGASKKEPPAMEGAE